MREIKFRVWDNVLKYYVNDGVFVEDKNGELKLIAYVDRVVEQFTGLTDKNGKDIYEGDIVDYGLFYYDGSDKWFKGTIEFDYYAFVIVNNKDEYNGCYLHQIENSDSDDANEMIEVIGNIHENGDLLK